MRPITILAATGLLLATTTAGASGYRPPAHSDLSYSFTCPSGASGHLRYVVDFSSEFAARLTLWVNGQYIQDDQGLLVALRGKNIEQLQASCEGDRTLVFLRTFDPSSSEQGTITIGIDRAGEITSIGN